MSDGARDVFVECACAQERKDGERACGDAFLSRKCPDGRLISVLSDGLGSGVKAGVLSTLTATMALRCIERRVPLESTARSIRQTLPVCRERQISYATFSIVEVAPNREVRVMEHDSPPFLYFRSQDGEPGLASMDCREIPVPGPGGEEHPGATLKEYRFQATEGDRVVIFSDGVNQSGMGSRMHPLGWGSKALETEIRRLLRETPDLSAASLSRSLVDQALSNDTGKAKDDITCGVIHFRRPRNLLVVSGPPFDPEKDAELAGRIGNFGGRKIICGGTTAGIVARHLGREVRVQMPGRVPKLPPPSVMEGVDLVTEGILTLGAVAEWLENHQPGERPAPAPEPADKVIELMRNSDIIHFAVGTRINDAHQDPSMPVELEIRRNVVKKIAHLLKTRYLKEVHLAFI